MMIISKKPRMIHRTICCARVTAQVVSGISFIGGDHPCVKNGVSGLTTASGSQPELDLRLAEDSGSSFPLCSDYRYRSKLAYQSSYKGETTSGKYLREIPDPTIVQSIWRITTATEDQEPIQVVARELDGEKYELVDSHS